MIILEKQKKIALINDMSCVGRCSLTAAVPIISACGFNCVPLPTGIFSAQSEFDGFVCDDLTSKMQSFADHWKNIGIRFDAIYTGYLATREQAEIVKRFLIDFKKSDTLCIVDPVMGDNGKIYTTYTDEMCKKMRYLASLADIITPNVTEACILAGEEYRGEDIDEEFTKKLLLELSLGGKRSVLITGVVRGENICTCVFDKDSGEIHTIKNRRINKSYPGTGDLFASVLCGEITCGKGLLEATEKAADFVEKTTEYTAGFETDINDGIAFESHINLLLK